MQIKTLALLVAIVCTFHYSSSAQIFSEQSAAVGIDHTFQPRALMGGGAAFFDYDNDGDDDLYLTGGLNRDDLYRNDGNGSFTKMGTNNGLEITVQYNTTAVITGDIDNDGDRDIFVSTWERYENGNEILSRNLLFENNGDGTFTDISTTAGITHPAFTIGANFLDYNKDGFIDIHVINHVETPRFLYDSTGVISGFDHDCFDNLFYHNNGDGTFSEVAAQLGVNDSGCALASLPSDYDMDGDPDIFIANDFGPFIVPNVLYQNDYPNNAFVDVSQATGADIPMYGMGIAAGDYDHDLDLDYYITNLGKNVLMENQNGVFVDVATPARVESTYADGSSDFATGWGTAFFDIDNDTWLDLFVANGRIPSLPSLPTAMNDPNKLFLNNGDKTFSDITDQNGVGDPSYGRGMAYSDFDADGDLDFVVVNQNELGGTTLFYRNESSNGNHYVQFQLVGKESNRDAYGAKLWLYAGGQTFLRETDGGGGSFCSQNTSIVHFGLGTIGQIDSLRIDWPGGHVDHLGVFAIDARHVVEEGIISGTKESETELGLSLSPNPFTTYLNVEVPSAAASPASVVRLITPSGQTIWRQESTLYEGNNYLELEETIPAGLYILQVQLEEKEWRGKVLKF